MKETVDIDLVMDMNKCFDPCIRYAIKKLLMSGDLLNKNRSKDIIKARDTLNNRLEMMAEDSEL